MTPTERRDTLIHELMNTDCVCDEGGTFCAPAPDEAGEMTDALTPEVEEWLAVAWDEGYAAMGDESRPIGEPIVNPYRRSIP